VSLAHRQAHGVGDALAERPRRDLDRGVQDVLGVARARRVQLAEVLRG
jgi:hypothetical protein